MTDADPTESTLDDLACEDPPKCPSCEVPYIEHLGLHGTCAALLAMSKERDELRAKLADVDAAIERNARIRRAEWTDDDRLFVADFTSEAAGFLAEMLLARLDMEKATNYAEVNTEDLGRLHVCLTGLQIDMCFRRTGAPTPHDLRLRAEKERDEALALVEERRVRLMLAGLEKKPEGWRLLGVRDDCGFGLAWTGALELACVRTLGGAFSTYVCERHGHFKRVLEVPFDAATEAWTHAQALRAYIEEHGVLPPEHTKEP